MRPHNVHQQTVGGAWTKGYVKRMILHARTDAERQKRVEAQSGEIMRVEDSRLTFRPFEGFCKDFLDQSK